MDIQLIFKADLPSQIENNFDSNIHDNTIQEIAEIDRLTISQYITLTIRKSGIRQLKTYQSLLMLILSQQALLIFHGGILELST